MGEVVGCGAARRRGGHGPGDAAGGAGGPGPRDREGEAGAAAVAFGLHRRDGAEGQRGGHHGVEHPSHVQTAPRYGAPGQGRRRGGALQQGRADLLGRGIGVAGGVEGHRPGDVRCGHRCAAVDAVAVTGKGREDPRARCAQIDAGEACVREAREGAAVGDRGHRHHGLVTRRCDRREAGGVGRGDIVVSGVVAGRRDEEDVGPGRPGNGIGQGLGGTAAPGIVAGHEADAVAQLQIREVVDCPDGIGGGAAVGSQEFGRDQRHRPADAGHPEGIAAAGTDGAGHVGPMLIGASIKDTVVVGDEIPAVDVVDVTVAVVVDSIHRVVGIDPGVGDQIGMAEIHALVNDADADAGGSGVAGGPGPCGVAAGHSPEGPGGEQRVIAHGREPQATVGFDETDPRTRGIEGQSSHQRPVVGQAHDFHHAVTPALHGAGVDRVEAATAHVRQRSRAVIGAGSGSPLHQQPLDRRLGPGLWRACQLARGCCWRWLTFFGDPQGDHPRLPHRVAVDVFVAGPGGRQPL